MPSLNPFKMLVNPRLPSAAVGLADDGVGVVALDHRRGDALVVRRAGYAALPEGLVRPDFVESNISNVNDLADIVAELVTSAGLLKQHKWSAALPEAATRTSILTLETTPVSRGELEEMLRWKIERAMGAPLEVLRVGRQRLRPDAQGRARYLVSAVYLSVLAEYEEVFAALGWQVGLILPRHMGEAWWLMKDHTPADALLVSAYREGFTVFLLRNGEPLLVRGITCEEADRADELYRFLLFYRDRIASLSGESGGDGAPTETIEKLLVAGSGLDEREASAIIEETLSAPPRTLVAEDLRLSFPSRDIDFNLIAAPAGLAALAWS